MTAFSDSMLVIFLASLQTSNESESLISPHQKSKPNSSVISTLSVPLAQSMCRKMVEAKKAMKEVEAKNQVLLWKLGDDKSSLLDHFERLSIELQLNQAMLRRSLSEPAYIRSEFPLLITQGPSELPPPPPPPPPSPPPPPPSPPHLVAKKRRRLGFNKVLRKMIKPILSRMSGKKKDIPIPDAKDPRFWRTFSRSVRI